MRMRVSIPAQDLRWPVNRTDVSVDAQRAQSRTQTSTISRTKLIFS
jgi:hypothetical protein